MEPNCADSRQATLSVEKGFASEGIDEYVNARDRFEEACSNSLLFSSEASYEEKKIDKFKLDEQWRYVRSRYELLDYSARLMQGSPPSPNEYPMLKHIARRDLCPKVSVIIPVYNAEEYIEECLQSVFGQTVTSLEVICVDDGSTDNSLAALEKMAELDDRLSIICRFNGGAATARNEGMRHARGEYFSFIDADDYYPDSDVLEKLLRAAVFNEALVCGGSFTTVSPDGEIGRAFAGDSSPYTVRKSGFRAFVDDQFDYGWIRFIYHSSLFEGGKNQFPELRWYEDPVFFAALMAEVGQYYLIEDEVYRYRVDYRERTWGAPSVRDLLKGICENLVLAEEAGYPKLFELLVRRLNQDYFDPIATNIEDDEVFLRLVEIQNILNRSKFGSASEVLSVFSSLKTRDISRDTAIVRMAKRFSGGRLYKAAQSCFERV